MILFAAAGTKFRRPSAAYAAAPPVGGVLERGDGTSYGSGGKGLGLGVDDIAPVQVPPLQAVDEDLRRGHIGGEGDVVLVAESGNILQIRVQIVGLGIGEEKHHVDLVVGDAGADLLAAAVLVGEEELDRQAGGLGHQAASRVGGADGVLGENAAVGNAELHHQLFFPVMAHQGNIHRTNLSSTACCAYRIFIRGAFWPSRRLAMLR